jgi:hypothetical protein
LSALRLFLKNWVFTLAFQKIPWKKRSANTTTANPYCKWILKKSYAPAARPPKDTPPSSEILTFQRDSTPGIPRPVRAHFDTAFFKAQVGEKTQQPNEIFLDVLKIESPTIIRQQETMHRAANRDQLAARREPTCRRWV